MKSRIGETEKLKVYITWKNILLMILMVYLVFLISAGIAFKMPLIWFILVVGMLALATGVTMLVRRFLMWMKNMN